MEHSLRLGHCARGLLCKLGRSDDRSLGALPKIGFHATSLSRFPGALSSLFWHAVRFLRRSPVQTFLLVPLATLAWEWALGTLHIAPVFLLVMLWGYLQYRLCGRYRIRLGGGGPGLSGAPPERLVETGVYAWTRNPMYLGHVIYLIGVALTFQSVFAAVIAVARTVWFHFRVLRDERGLRERFGEPYVAYTRRVKRWLPGLF